MELADESKEETEGNEVADVSSEPHHVWRNQKKGMYVALPGNR